MKNGKLIKILAIAAIFIVVGFVVLKIYDLTSGSLTTQTVYEQTVLDTVDADMFIIRDEILLSSDSTGVIVPIAANGERVSRGSEIAAVFLNETTAENFNRLGTLKDRLASYQKINSQLRLANLDIGKLTNEINADFLSIVNAAYENDFSTLSDDELSFAEKLSRKQISLNEAVDCTQKIADLESEIALLESSAIPLQIISADTSGYYVSKPDGYENILTTADIATLSAAQLDVAFSAEKKEVPSNSLGKIISGYNWYVACRIDSGKLKDYTEGDSIKLILGDSEDDVVVATLDKMITVDINESIAIFKCNLMNDELATLRKVSGKIVIDEITGCKVRKDAVRVDENGVSNVFVRRGNIVSIRSLNIVYTGDNFVIAAAPSEKSGIKLPYAHVKLYDEVVTSGKDLHDGMVIG